MERAKSPFGRRNSMCVTGIAGKLQCAAEGAMQRLAGHEVWERQREVAQILESRLLLHSMWAQGHPALLIRTCRTFDFLSHHLFQVQMKDFRFSYKFKMACKEDVLKLCPNIKKKYVAFNWFVLLPNMSGDLLHSGRIGPGGFLYAALGVWLPIFCLATSS